MTEHEPGSEAWVRHQIMVDVGSDEWVGHLQDVIREAFEAGADPWRKRAEKAELKLIEAQMVASGFKDAHERAQAALSRLRPIAVAARNLLDGWAVTLEDERLNYVEGQLVPADIDALRAALDGHAQPEAKTELERAVRAYLDELTSEGGVLLYGQRLDELRAALDGTKDQ